jgi:hypothetical protein
MVGDCTYLFRNHSHLCQNQLRVRYVLIILPIIYYRYHCDLHKISKFFKFHGYLMPG